MSESINLSLSSDEVRFIAVYRTIKEFGRPDYISTEDTGFAVSLLTSTITNLSNLETQLKANELKLFLRGFISGLAAQKVQQDPYGLSQVEEETNYVGGPTGGVAIGQGVDSRFVTNTGPQE